MAVWPTCCCCCCWRCCCRYGTSSRTDIPEVGASPWAKRRHCCSIGADAAAAGVESAAVVAVAAADAGGGGDGGGDDCESNRRDWRTNRLTDAVVVVNREATVAATSHYCPEDKCTQQQWLKKTSVFSTPKTIPALGSVSVSHHHRM